MEYYKLKIEFKPFPKRLNRTILVRKDVDLFSLGCIITNIFYGVFEHLFSFKDSQHLYSLLTKDSDYFFEEEIDMRGITLEEVDKKFLFTYDFGDNYEFKCTRYDDIENLKQTKLAIVKKATGKGIFEDNITTLYDYLDGQITDMDINEEGIYSYPWNFDLNSLDEFDDVSIEQVQKTLSHVKADINEMMQNYYGDEEQETISEEQMMDFFASLIDNLALKNKKVKNKFEELKLNYNGLRAYEKMIELLSNCIEEGKEPNKIEKLFIKKVDTLK